MEILLKKKSFCHYGPTTAEYKAFFEKFGGQWVPVETAYLFTDQYNVSDGNGGGVRVMDCDIEAVRDDARRGLGRCRYCGAMIRAGEENAHFEEMENAACVLDDSGAIVRACDRCFWLQSRRVNEKTETEEKTLLNGREVIKRTTWEREEKYCSYKADDLPGVKLARPCTKYACRAYGVEWFTEKNTFFLKYPDGFNVPRLLVPREFVKIGSYTFERGDRFSADDLYYKLENNRVRVRFIWDETAEEWRKLSGGGWSSDNFAKVPYNVRAELRRVLLIRGEVWRAINAGFSDAAKKRLAFNDLGGACLEIFRKFEAEKADFLGGLISEERKQKIFCEWCAGLPSSFRPAFETFRQREALRKWGGRPVSEENAAAVYYGRIAAEVWEICAAARLAVEK